MKSKSDRHNQTQLIKTRLLYLSTMCIPLSRGNAEYE